MCVYPASLYSSCMGCLGHLFPLSRTSFSTAAVFKKHRFFLVLIRKSKIRLRLDFLIFCPFSASKLSYNFLKIDQELLNRGANVKRFIKALYKVEAHGFLKTFLIFAKFQPRLSYSDFLIKKTECSGRLVLGHLLKYCKIK